MDKCLRKFLGGILLFGVVGLLLTGCQKNDGDNTEGANPNPKTFGPSGNIQGVVRDAVTGVPLVGAELTIDVPGSSPVVATTNTAGQYSFEDVPGSGWNDGSGGPADGIVQAGELLPYTVTLDLRPLNEPDEDDVPPLPQNTYPDFAFQAVAVGFASFSENNTPTFATCLPGPAGPGAGGGGGGGAACVEGDSSRGNTPIEGLTVPLNFDIGALTETIAGRVLRDGDLAPIENVTVTLFDAGIIGAVLPIDGTPAPVNLVRITLPNTTVTTDANGDFSFTGVSAQFTYQAKASLTGWNDAVTGSVTTFGSSSTVLVPATGSNTPPGVNPPVSTPGVGEIILSQVQPGVDTTPPIAISASPTDGSDIDVTADGVPSQPFAIVFNESVAVDAFEDVAVFITDFKGFPVPASSVPGAPPGGQVNVSIAFSTTTLPNDTLTVTPFAPWQEGLTYGIFLGPGVIGSVSGLRDTAGNFCCNQNVIPPTAIWDIPGDALAPPVFGEPALVAGAPGGTPSVLLFTTNATGGAIPGPAVAQVSSSTDFFDTAANLTWPEVTGARAYRVYAAVRRDLGGDFQQIWESLPGNEPLNTTGPIDINFMLSTSGPICVPTAPPGAPAVPGILGEDGVCRNLLETAIRDDGDLIAEALGAPAPTTDYSDGFNSVAFAVSVVNRNDVEGALGTPLDARDNTAPGLGTTGGPDTQTFGPVVPATTPATFRILISDSEPLDEATAETAANYTLVDSTGTAVDLTTRGLSLGTPVLNNDVDGNGIKCEAGGALSAGDCTVTIPVSNTITPGSPPDIRDGDFVQVSGVLDLAAVPNTNKAVTGQAFTDISPPFLVAGTVSSINGVFSEPIEINGVPQVVIGGQDCTANGQVSVAVDGGATITTFPGLGVIVNLTIDPAAGAANPLCNQDGINANSFASFAGLVTDDSAAMNPILGTLDTLVGPVTGGVLTGNLAVAADPPTDTTNPVLQSVGLTDGTGSTVDAFTFNFSEDIVTVPLGSTFVASALITGSDATQRNCTAQITQPPNTTLNSAAISVLMTPTDLGSGAASGDCNLANAVTGDSITLSGFVFDTAFPLPANGLTGANATSILACTAPGTCIATPGTP